MAFEWVKTYQCKVLWSGKNYLSAQLLKDISILKSSQILSFPIIIFKSLSGITHVYNPRAMTSLINAITHVYNTTAMTSLINEITHVYNTTAMTSLINGITYVYNPTAMTSLINAITHVYNTTAMTYV